MFVCKINYFHVIISICLFELFSCCLLLLFLQLGLDISPDKMADLGIGGIGADDDDDDDDDEESLEAELAALQGESRSKVKKKSKAVLFEQKAFFY